MILLDVYVFAFLFPTLGGDEWAASHPGSFVFFNRTLSGLWSPSGWQVGAHVEKCI